VLGVFPQGVKDVYRLTFAGGAVTECCEDHMWTVTNEYDRLIGRSRNLTMRQLLDGGIHYRCGTAKWAVPMVDPVEFDSPEPLPIDSYLLGVLLGDGSFRGNRAGSGGVALASHADDADEMENLLEPTLPAGVTMSRRVRRGHSTEFYFRGRGGPTPNPLTAAVRDLGLFDVIGHSKFIPAQYMQASVKDRVALLQGLIDTDGCVSSSAGAVFVNTSERLVTQTKELVECLGGIARMTQARPATDTSREQWQVYISQLPGWIIPCKLARKVAEWNPQPARRWRTL
jgi:ATP-dependent DNA helicase RecG